MVKDVIVYMDTEFDARHGGPFDRGMADSWYNRMISPHYYKGDTAMSEKVELADMTGTEVTEYLLGYQFNDELGDKKEW